MCFSKCFPVYLCADDRGDQQTPGLLILIAYTAAQNCQTCTYPQEERSVRCVVVAYALYFGSQAYRRGSTSRRQSRSIPGFVEYVSVWGTTTMEWRTKRIRSEAMFCPPGIVIFPGHRLLTFCSVAPASNVRQQHEPHCTWSHLQASKESALWFSNTKFVEVVNM